MLAGGPVNFTVALADDPPTAARLRLAFAFYGGWDTANTLRPASDVHDEPEPGTTPSGRPGSTLLDYAVARPPGARLSRTYDLTATYGGEYTVFVAALGGVRGSTSSRSAAAPNPGRSQRSRPGDLRRRPASASRPSTNARRRWAAPEPPPRDDGA